MNNRGRRIVELEAAIADRTLLWFGIRGEDAVGLLPLRQFRESFSITAPLYAAKLDVVESVEQLTGRRVDLDAYDIDLDDEASDVVEAFRRRLLARANQHSVIATYRPSHLLSDVSFASRDTARYLGLFKDFQNAFEYKPWIETELQAVGVRTVPWVYIADEYRHTAQRLLEDGPIVLRASRGSGGVGLALVATSQDLESKWLFEHEQFGAVAPYLADAVPVNVGGCVFGADEVRLHPGSLQLIGLPSCTTRTFGYCGNDFRSFRDVGEHVIAEIDRVCRVVGRWLGSRGYRGAYGVDLLVNRGDVLFGEVNPRFQGSTAMSINLAASIHQPDIVMDHLAAFLDIEPGNDLSLLDWANEIAGVAQVIVHNREDHPVQLATALTLPDDPDSVRLELLPELGTLVDPGAVLTRLVFNEQVTRTGLELTPSAEACVQWFLERVGT